ncbi:MAG: ABC transporter permease [Rhodocyclaceae bacterium]|nr:ABC transporter permease [Rhodocyclaceae bacterium]
MKALFALAFKSAWARRFLLTITLVAIALATSLLLAIERVRLDARTSFTQAVSGVDLVVGARGGALELMLNAVFHAGGSSHTIRWDSFEAWRRHPAVAWAVPVSLGDAYRGFPVVGTTPDYFRHLHHGDKKPLTFAAGRSFAGDLDSVFEAVVGHTVASQLGLRTGERITLSHGMTELSPLHADKPFTIVGILAPTGTPMDRAVFVSLEAISAIHLDWVAGAPTPGLSIPAELVRKFDLAPKTITAFYLGLHQRADVFRLQRAIHSYVQEPLLAVLPGVALDELWSLLTQVETTLLTLSALVVVVGLAGLSATMLASLESRRRELAILRSLGAGAPEILLLLATEGMIVTAAGILAGLVLLALALIPLAPLAHGYGIHLSWRPPAASEWMILGAIFLSGILSSLVPGLRALRMTLVDGLTPRS